jgi:hypothetical protein
VLIRTCRWSELSMEQADVHAGQYLLAIKMSRTWGLDLVGVSSQQTSSKPLHNFHSVHLWWHQDPDGAHDQILLARGSELSSRWWWEVESVRALFTSALQSWCIWSFYTLGTVTMYSWIICTNKCTKTVFSLFSLLLWCPNTHFGSYSAIIRGYFKW